MLTATHAADSRLILAQDAQVTAMMLQNLGPVLASLQPTRDAVLRIGALLIVKVNWVVQVIQLTAAQQAVLDHRPELATKPHEIVAASQLRHADTASAPTPEPNRGSNSVSVTQGRRRDAASCWSIPAAWLSRVTPHYAVT